MPRKVKNKLCILCVLLSLLLLAACGSSASQAPAATAAPTQAPTAAPTPEPTPDPEAEAAACLDEARGLFEDGKSYEAALAIRDLQEAYPDSAAFEESEALMDEITESLKSIEPKTGELERTIQYQGGHEVRILALSGPVEMLITDVDNPSQYVRFYVRQGEMSEIYLVSGTYKATWKIGKCWFGDDIGFGELYTEGAREDYMSVQTKQEGGWIVNWRWTDIL